MADTSELPRIEVRYTDLSLTMRVSAASASRTMPTVFETLAGAATALPRALAAALTQAPPPPMREVRVLDGASGVIRPGTMTLLLGHPGAGKSTFLKALCGRLSGAAAAQLRGSVQYGGLAPPELAAAGLCLGQLVQYVSQLDEHFPFLTVRESLAFVARNAIAGADEAAVNARVEEISELLHLKGCADTIIGDDLARGVSGGEKKRVTVGEGLITAARVLALDEISTGLDSSVTFDVIKSLRARAQRQGLAVVVALLQPTPETVALFDDVILLREGAVVYHGAREELPAYLRGQGFLLPAAAGTEAGGEGEEDLADWLSELLTYPLRRHAKDVAREGGGSAGGGLSLRLPASGELGAAAPTPSAPPLTTAAMAAAWQASPLRAHNLRADKGAQPPALTTPAARAQYGVPYVHSALSHASSLLARQVRLLSANSLFVFIRIFSAFFMAIVFGGLYWQGGVDDGLNKYGLYLNCVMQLLFTNISEMSGAVEGKFIGYRQVANGVYPAWTFPLASILAHIPLALAEALCFGCVSYFMVGLTYEASRFFFFILVIFLIDVFAATMFRLFAFAAPTLVSAQAGPMPIIALVIMFCGFMVARSKMGWMEFIYWANPAAWAIMSLAQNEFYAPRYSIRAGGPGTPTLGESYLSLMDQQLNPVYLWAGVLYIIAATLVLMALGFLAFATVRYDRNMGSARAVEEGAPQGALALTLGGSSSSSSSSSGSLDALPSAASAVDLTLTPSVPSPLSTTLGTASASSVLPFTPLALAWRDLTYTVQLSARAGGGHRQLLMGITGYAKPGRLLALMGASGAGKTTLLDVLAGRKNTGVQAGAVFLQGHPKNAATFNRSASYCEQTDLHMPLTTVREALDFSAELRLPATVTAAQRSAYVEEVMQLLELSALRDAKVGTPGSPDGLSPGERKRLTIGVELAANAPILFLDEPTSGLDARAAAVVVRVIRRVACTGRTIICTVHQPSAEVFSQFDDLLLLQRGGWQVYFGPIGARSSALVGHLTSLPGTPPLPRGFNPASWMLDVLAGTDSSGGAEAATSRAGASLTGDKYQAAFFESPAWRGGADKALEGLCTPSASDPHPVAFTSPHARSFGAQWLALLKRAARTYSRNIPMNVGRIAAITFLCTLFGTIYFDLARRADDYQGMRTLVAAIFMTAAFSAMLNMDASLPTLISSRSSFYRENAALMYNSGAYVLANFVVELPWLAGIVLLGTSIGYFMIGLAPSAPIFFTHYLSTYVLALVLVSFGQAVAATMPSFDTAQAVVGILAPILFLFGGMFSKPSSMPPGSKWLNTIDPIVRNSCCGHSPAARLFLPAHTPPRSHLPRPPPPRQAYAFRALIPLHFYCEGSGCPTMSVLDKDVKVDRWAFVESQYELSYGAVWSCIGFTAIFVAVFQAANVYATFRIRHISR